MICAALISNLRSNENTDNGYTSAGLPNLQVPLIKPAHCTPACEAARWASRARQSSEQFPERLGHCGWGGSVGGGGGGAWGQA